MKMCNFDANVAAAFKCLADEVGLPVHRASDDSIEIYGHDLLIRVRSQIERVRGIFVTIDRRGGGQRCEYGLPYLVEYNGGSKAEIDASVSDDLSILMQLTKRYAIDYLIGKTTDFSAFETFAARKTAERVPKTPEIKANKWIRPEWIEVNKSGNP